MWSTLLLLCVASVANAATEYEIDQKFTSVAALDGQLFAIVNETDAKAIYNKDNQNLAYDSYTNAVGGAAYLFKLHSLADAGIEQLENAYAIECVKADGSSQSVYGQTPIYLNSGAEGGFDGCFVLGNGSQYGTDVLYGGAWEIEYDTTNGFALKNVARGGYFAGVNPAPTGEDPIYWTFCTLKAGEEIPDPVIDEPEAPLAQGELIPDFFSICDEGGIPYGYEVKFGSENRAYPSTFTGGARIFNFGENGDFTKAIYFREGYVRYGNVKALALEADKEYTVCFNSAMWKASGATLVFSIFKEGDLENAVLTQTIDNTPDVNGSKDAVTGSTRSEIKFTPEEDGNYILEWNADGWKEVLLANVAVKVAEAGEPEPQPETAFADGKYYFKNVGAGLYWGAGNSWGTQASLLKNPDYLTLVSNEDGTYKLESQVSNGGTAYYFNGSYMDNGSPVSLTITKLENGFYTIANGETFYGSDGSTILAALESGAEANAQWEIITEADMLASLANATKDAPVDATFLIADHTFGRNNRNVSAWTNEGSAALTGGNSNKHDAEKYHGEFNVYQKLANAPAGIYKLTAQGFYRQDGTDEENLPVFYANDEKVTFPVKTGSENSMADACTSFEAGLYAAAPIFVQVTEAGELTVGAKLETNTTLWAIWDNFQLTYYGTEGTIDEVRFASYYDEAIANIKSGETYLIYTEVDGTNYYLDATGTLTDAANAATFEITKATANGTAYPIGWNLGVKFTNPDTGGNTTFTNDGHIHNGNNDRNDWERQVFFMNEDGLFAVRATNATNLAWGANTYWDVFTEAEMPEAGYSLEPSFVWHIAGHADASSLIALAEKLEAQIAATETYDDPNEIGASIAAQIEPIKTAFYTSKQEVDAAIEDLAELAKQFFNGIEIKKDIDVTDWYIVNPAPMNKNGWEGTNFGSSSDGVCEYWSTSPAEFHQTITLPAGVYKLTAIALTRTGMDGKIYAGENSVGIATVANSVVNSRPQAAAWFAEGNGVNEVIFQMAEAGEITIGLIVDETSGDHWTVWKNFKLEMITATPVDVTYNLVNGETILATEVVTQLSGDEVKVPASFDNLLHGLFTMSTETETIEKETTTVNVVATWNGPFDFSTDFENAKWYNMNIRGGWQVSKCETEPYTMKQNATKYELASPEFQWAFLPVANDPLKVVIVNKAAEGQSLTPADVAEGEGTRHAVVLREGEYAWDIFANADGFVLREVGTENGWVNQAGGGSATSPLAFWDNAAGKTDGGSTFRVSEVPELESTAYTGIIMQSQSHPKAGPMGDSTSDQTVTITEAGEGLVNITFSGFALPMAALGSFDEFTVENVAVTEYEGVTVYLAEDFQVPTSGGQMPVPYNGTLVGAKETAESTPVIKLILQNATTDVCYFGANEEDINRFKAQEPKEALKTYDLTANDVEVSDWSTITIADATIISEAATLLGAQPSELIYQLVDTTGVRKDYNGNEGEVLFWVDYNGNKSNWGVNNKYYISYDAETPAITVTQFGAEYSKTLNAVVRLENADGDFVEFKINVTMEDVPVINPEIVKTIEIEGFDLAETAYNADENHLPTFDVAEVCTALGIDNISNAETYIVNVTTGEFVKNTTDGWRNADGDATAWGQATNGYCLKLSDPASGQFDYSGAHDANFAAGDTYLAQWAIVAGEKAVLLKVTINFLSQDDYNKATGINGIAADVENGKVFNIAGQKTGRVQKGVNIIGGKKVYVK